MFRKEYVGINSEHIEDHSDQDSECVATIQVRIMSRLFTTRTDSVLKIQGVLIWNTLMLQFLVEFMQVSKL